MSNGIQKWVRPGPIGTTLVIEAVAPASISGDQVIWQSGAGNENYRVRVVLKSDWTVQFTLNVSSDTTVGLQRFALTLDGNVAAGQPFKVAVSMQRQKWYASLDGNTAAFNNNNVNPPTPALMLGRDTGTSNDFAGTFKRLKMKPSITEPDALANLALRIPVEEAIVTIGDSYFDTWPTVDTVRLYRKIATATGRPVYNLASQGAEVAAQVAALEAPPDLQGRLCILFGGFPNGYGSVAAYRGLQDQYIEGVLERGWHPAYPGARAPSHPVYW